MILKNNISEMLGFIVKKCFNETKIGYDNLTHIAPSH